VRAPARPTMSLLRLGKHTDLMYDCRRNNLKGGLKAVDPLIIIPALGDNFIYLYQYDRSSAVLVDPSNSSSVLQIIEKRKLNLSTILVTHHHWDHIAGAAKLKSKTGCQITGSDKHRIPGIDTVVDDGQTLTIGSTDIQVIATPGHTRTSVCYYMPPSGTNKSGILWLYCGKLRICFNN